MSGYGPTLTRGRFAPAALSLKGEGYDAETSLSLEGEGGAHRVAVGG